MRTREGVNIHPSADVADDAELGPGTRVWHQAQVRERSRVGRDCILGKGVYIDFEVRIGDRCKLQNGVFVYHGFNLEDGVFVGPGAMLLNDKSPRAINPDGTLKSEADWTVSRGVVKQGASLGGGAVAGPHQAEGAAGVGGDAVAGLGAGLDDGGGAGVDVVDGRAVGRDRAARGHGGRAGDQR